MRSRKTANAVVVVASVIAASATALHVSAQAPRARGAIEEITVTAQRVEERIQDVPLAVVALSGDELEQRGVQRVGDLIARIPNVQVTGDANHGGTGGLFTIRGIPDVLTYVDGAWGFWTYGSIARQVIEVERIEVIKGPQGTLFGKDATGGAIQYVTKPPADEFGVRASATLGDYGRNDVTAAVDLPLSDTVKTKWTAASLQRDGYVDSLSIDRSYGDLDDEVLRADVLWTPSDTFRLRFNIENNEYRANGQARITLSIYDPQPDFSRAQAYLLGGFPFTNLEYAAGFPGGEVGERESKSANWNDGWTLDEERAILDLEWAITPNMTLKSITADFSAFDTTSIDHCSCELNLLYVKELTETAIASQEIQLRSEHGRVRWIVGAYYYETHARQQGAIWQFKEFRDDPTLLPVEFPGNVAGGFSDTSDSLALFGQATIRLQDRLSVTVGLREFQEDGHTSRLACAATVNDDIGADPLGGLDSCTVDYRIPLSFDHNTPRASLEYVWNDSLMSYVSYAEGFNSGGVTVPFVPGLPATIPFDPEIVETVELGVRSDWFEGRLRFNATLFTTDWTDIQVPVFLPDPGNAGAFLPIGITANAAGAQADGVEVEVIAAPAENWRFDFGLGLLDARYTDVRGSAADIAADTPFANAPDRSFAFGVQNDRDLRNGARITARLDYGWVDDYITMPQAVLQVAQNSYGLLSAHVSYELPGRQYRLVLFGTNLTDEYYFDSAVTDPATGYTTATLGRPREIGFGLHASFE